TGAGRRKPSRSFSRASSTDGRRRRKCSAWTPGQPRPKGTARAARVAHELAARVTDRDGLDLVWARARAARGASSRGAARARGARARARRGRESMAQARPRPRAVTRGARRPGARARAHRRGAEEAEGCSAGGGAGQRAPALDPRCAPMTVRGEDNDAPAPAPPELLELLAR